MMILSQLLFTSSGCPLNIANQSISDLTGIEGLLIYLGWIAVVIY